MLFTKFDWLHVENVRKTQVTFCNIVTCSNVTPTKELFKNVNNFTKIKKTLMDNQDRLVLVTVIYNDDEFTYEFKYSDSINENNFS